MYIRNSKSREKEKPNDRARARTLTHTYTRARNRDSGIGVERSALCTRALCRRVVGEGAVVLTGGSRGFAEDTYVPREREREKEGEWCDFIPPFSCASRTFHGRLARLRPVRF